MPTIYDVAKRAGVSVATVSAVINKSAFVSDKLKGRVNLAINELGYRPNLLARSLAQQRTQTIGILIPDIANPFYSEIVRGAEDKAQKYDYTIIVGNSDNLAEKEEVYLNLFLSKNVDGLLLIKAPGEMEDRLIQKLKSDKPPLVLIDREYSPLKAYSVLADDFGGARKIVQHLINQGHRRIGIIIGQPDVSTAKSRLAGYREALSVNGIAYDEDLIVQGNYGIQPGYEAGLELLQRSPDGVFVTNWTMTVGFLRAMGERRLRCPQDISLVSYDDFVWAEYFHPRLTSVAQPKYELGFRSAEVLLGKIKGKHKRPKVEVLANKIVIRESCGAGLSRLPKSGNFASG